MFFTFCVPESSFVAIGLAYQRNVASSMNMCNKLLHNSLPIGQTSAGMRFLSKGGALPCKNE